MLNSSWSKRENVLSYAAEENHFLSGNVILVPSRLEQRVWKSPLWPLSELYSNWRLNPDPTSLLKLYDNLHLFLETITVLWALDHARIENRAILLIWALFFALRQSSGLIPFSHHLRIKPNPDCYPTSIPFTHWTQCLWLLSEPLQHLEVGHVPCLVSKALY